MTISGTYSQSVSLTFIYTTNPRFGSQQALETTTPATAPATDRVDLSPEATAASAAARTPPSSSPTAVASLTGSTPSTQPGSTPGSVAVSVSVSQQTTVNFSAVGQSTSPSSGSQRADALFGALDGNHNGSITKQEFTDGAAALLRHGRSPRRQHREHRADDGQQVQHEGRVPRGLEKRLARVFAQVDANHDGAVDQGELTTALGQAGKPQAGQSTAAPSDAAPTSPSAASPTPAAGQFETFSVTQVTTVSFAVQRYTAVAQASGNTTPGSLNATA